MINRINRSKALQFALGLTCWSSACLLGCTQGQNELSKDRVLTVGVSADYPPFEFRKGDETVGFDVDVIQALAKELGATVQFQDMDFSAIIPAVQSGRVDIGLGVTVTEERKKNIDFSEIYFKSTYALITQENSPVQGPRDLAGKKIGVQLGTTLEKFAKENLVNAYPNLSLVALGKFPTLVQELKVHRIAGIVSEEVQSIEFVKANPGMKKIRLGTSEDGYAFAFKPGNPLRMNFNSAIQKLTQKGDIGQIYSKWMDGK